MANKPKPIAFKLTKGSDPEKVTADQIATEPTIRLCVGRADWFARYPWTKGTQGETRCTDCQADVVYNKDDMPMLPNMTPLCIECATIRIKNDSDTDPPGVLIPLKLHWPLYKAPK